MAESTPGGTDPTAIRRVFGDNLRLLLQDAPPVRQICEAIGLHRSQFNRFLNGEAFPKPDVLHRICRYFDVDARILLEPLGQRARETAPPSMRLSPEISDFLQIAGSEGETAMMPVGFYRHVRRNYRAPLRYQWALTYVYVVDGQKYVKGFMDRNVARELGIPVNSARDREFRGAVLALDTGIAFFAAHRGARSFTMNYLERRQIGAKWLLVGHCARTLAQRTGTMPAGPIVLEPLPPEPGAILSAARSTGLVGFEDLPGVVQTIFEAQS